MESSTLAEQNAPALVEKKEESGSVPEGHIAVPTIVCHNKFPMDLVYKHMEACLDAHFVDIAYRRGTEYREAIIISGGPSIDSQVDNIKALIPGRFTVCIDRMQTWCWGHGIIPDYVVCVDGSPNVQEPSITQTSPYTTYLIATQVSPELVQVLQEQRARVFIFCSVYPDDEKDKIKKTYADRKYQHYSTMNGGASVSLTAMLCASMFGAPGWHVFGYDCHISDGGYAKGVTGGLYPEEAHPDKFEVHVNGRTFWTIPAYWANAQQFFTLYNLTQQRMGLKFAKVYGDSAVVAMADENCRHIIKGNDLVPAVQLSSDIVAESNPSNPLNEGIK